MATTLLFNSRGVFLVFCWAELRREEKGVGAFVYWSSCIITTHPVLLTRGGLFVVITVVATVHHMPPQRYTIPPHSNDEQVLKWDSCLSFF